VVLAGGRAQLVRIGAIRRGFRDSHRFPFPLGAPLPEGALEVLLGGSALLRDAGVPHFVADGTLLGLHRDGGLIPHDTDLDVYTWGRWDWRRVKRCMASLGFKVGRLVTYRGLLQQLAFYSPRHDIFDITNWWDGEDGWFYNWLPELKSVRRQPSYHFSSSGVIRIGDCGFSAPKDTEGWLNFVYGGGWRVPQVAKSSWIESSRDVAPEDVSRSVSERIAPKWWRRRP
jgi:hypothetical protein